MTSIGYLTRSNQPKNPRVRPGADVSDARIERAIARCRRRLLDLAERALRQRQDRRRDGH